VTVVLSTYPTIARRTILKTLGNVVVTKVAPLQYKLVDNAMAMLELDGTKEDVRMHELNHDTLKGDLLLSSYLSYFKGFFHVLLLDEVHGLKN
jgi:hypothetical protein